MGVFSQKRRYNKNPARRVIPGPGAQNQRTRQTPIEITSAEVTTSPNATIELFFDGPVLFTGIPPVGSFVGLNPAANLVSVHEYDPQHYALTYDTPIFASTGNLTIAFEDPSFRNAAGGYIRTETVDITVSP